MLGAGRATKADVIDPAVGVLMHKRVGDELRAGEPICTLYVNDERNLADAQRILQNAIEIGDAPPELRPLVHAVIEG